MASLPTLARRVPQQTRDRFVDLVRAGNTVGEACRELEVDRWVFLHPRYGLVATEPEYANAYGEAVLLGQGVLHDDIENEIRFRAMSRDRKDSALFLKLLAQRHIPQYRPTARVELTGAGGGPVTFEDRSASLAEVAKVLQAAGALSNLELDCVDAEAVELSSLPQTIPVGTPEQEPEILLEEVRELR